MLPAMSTPARLLCALSLVTAAACTPGPADDETGQASTGTANASETTGATATPTTGDEPTGGTTGEAHVVPQFGANFTIVGTDADGLDVVRDLEFNPDAPDQLWTFNMLIHGTVIFFDPGTPEQTSEVRVDAYGQHFMAYVSSGAFSDIGTFATCHESRDEWNVGPQEPDDFMGPALWPSDLAVYAEVGQAFPPEGGVEGSHLDMLHQSPLCMGIAHEKDNAFWAFDGMNGNIVRYDFQADHGPGGGDHTDGIITRYVDATVTRVANTVGHMELDHATGMLYVADTGAGRIMRLDTASGTDMGALSGDKDGATYTGVEGADYAVLVDGLDEPAGIAVHDGHIFVSEHGTGDIIAFDLEGTEVDRMSTPADRIMGITIGPAGDLWYVDAGADQVVRVDP
jgi:hypothetical protein